jgi:hypothetical protein
MAAVLGRVDMYDGYLLESRGSCIPRGSSLYSRQGSVVCVIIYVYIYIYIYIYILSEIKRLNTGPSEQAT